MFYGITLLTSRTDIRISVLSASMTDQARTRGRGRPPRHIIDVLFTHLWLGAIKARTGLSLPDAIEEHLEPRLVQRSKDGTKRTRKWALYEAGQRVPQGPTISVAEARYPGTARFINSPMRALLREDLVSARWVREQLLSLPAPVVDLLSEPRPANRGLPRLMRPFDQERADALVRQGGFAALEAAVLLMKWAELISSPALRKLARETSIRIHPSLRDSLELWPAIDSVLVAVDISFPSWAFLRPDLRCEVLQFTYVRRGDDPFGPCEIDAAETLVRAIFDRNREALEPCIQNPDGPPVVMGELLNRLSRPERRVN